MTLSRAQRFNSQARPATLPTAAEPPRADAPAVTPVAEHVAQSTTQTRQAPAATRQLNVTPRPDAGDARSILSTVLSANGGSLATVLGRSVGRPSAVRSAQAPSMANASADDDDDTGPSIDPTDLVPAQRLGSSSSATPASQTPGRKVGGLRVMNEHVLGIATPKRPTVNFTDQQNTVIHCPAKIIVVKAFAGAGKTTTAVGFADARPNQRILYLAFNKGIQMEAERRFGPNVTCRTTHSLAWQAVGRFYSKRIPQSWRAKMLETEAGIPSTRDAAVVQGILNAYFHSDDDEIKASHGEEVAVQFNIADHELHGCLAHARNVWRRMQDRSDSISMPHDAYLKMWAMSRPKLNYDCIIFDEAQDSNPVTSQIVRAQAHANLLYIGDPHQSIYGFRGARNAMDDFANSAKHLHLSQTWRFGPRVAHVANLILGEFKNETIKIEGMGTDAPYEKGACITKLARTNAQLFKDAAQRRGEGIHWIGKAESYHLDRLIQAFHLYKGNRSMVSDPLLRHFSSWAEMQNYAEEAKDPETRVLSEVVEEFRNETPGLVEQIKRNEVHDASQADLVLTTAHRAKGLDWDYVQLAEDFEILTETEADLAQDPNAPVNEQEINLLYVAATRAKKRLALNEETIAWMKALPEHRSARQLAIDKLNRRNAVRHEVLG